MATGEHDMLDDEWWHPFTSDANDYELGGAVGESTTRGHVCGCAGWSYRTGLLHLQFNPGRQHPAPARNTLTPGFGASSTVYAAAFNVPNSFEGDWRECAVKVSSGSDLSQLTKEAHMLGLCRHPNVLR